MALLALELASPGGFYLFFFGCGALAAGLLAALGLAQPLWLQGVVFTGLSVISLLVFRRPLLKKMHAGVPDVDVDSLVGERALALDEVVPNGNGKAELRGTTWNVRNAGESPIGPGQSCRVERIDGLTLWIRSD